MKKVFKIFEIYKLVAALVIFIVVSCHFTQQTLPTDTNTECNGIITEAIFNSWFESGAVSLNGAVKPANSLAFENRPNCSFYKWSEQMFLWLTSPAPKRYNSKGLIMNSPSFYDVSPFDTNFERTFIPHVAGKLRVFNLRKSKRGTLGLPVILEKKTFRLLEILDGVNSQSGNQLVLNKLGQEIEISKIQFDKNKLPTFFDQKGKKIENPRAIIHSTKDKTIPRVIKNIERISNFDKTTLIQKFHFGNIELFLDLFGNVINVEQGQSDGNVLMAQNGSLVYYSITVNEVYAYFRTMLSPTFPSTTRFPTTQMELDAITSFATSHGKTLKDPNALAIEIKCSWVEAEGLPDSDKFIKMMTTVPNYNKTDPNHWVQEGSKTVELAMVGMHVVGSTIGHPELLWATFEHLSNAPNTDYTYNSNIGSTTTILQNTSGNWVFCAGGATEHFNESHIKMEGNNIISTDGNTISPSNILRINPWGKVGSSARSNTEVININNSVRSLLDPNDLRSNYIQTGTTWTRNGSDPNVSGNQVGTNMLANTTLETFVQSTPPNISPFIPGQNCFSCHRTNTTEVSRIFFDTKPLF